MMGCRASARFNSKPVRVLLQHVGDLEVVALRQYERFIEIKDEIVHTHASYDCR